MKNCVNVEFEEVSLLNKIFININEYSNCDIFENNGYNIELINKYNQIENICYCVDNVDILYFIRENCYLEKYDYIISISFNCINSQYYIRLNEIIK